MVLFCSYQFASYETDVSHNFVLGIIYDDVELFKPAKKLGHHRPIGLAIHRSN